jgi:hypothetical protein
MIEDSEVSDEELLLEYYSEGIAEADPEWLKEDPELFFRRGCAWLAVIGLLDDFQERMSQLPNVQNDFQFVMDHSAKTSRIYVAARVKMDLIDAIIEAAPQTEEEAIEVILLHNERYLRQLVKDPLVSSDELVQEAFLNIQDGGIAAGLFHHYALLLNDEPDLALGYVDPDEVEVLGIVPHRDHRPTLLYQIEYYNQFYGYYSLHEEL